MGRSKVRRQILLEGDVSRELDQMAQAQDAPVSRLAARMIREGIERRRQVQQEMEALNSAVAGTVVLVGLFMLAFVGL